MANNRLSIPLLGCLTYPFSYGGALGEKSSAKVKVGMRFINCLVVNKVKI